jgi:prepilin-type processing-associated H-X9-DG protein
MFPQRFRNELIVVEENLIGYLLNALEPAEQRQVEQYLAGDSSARQRLAILRSSLAPLDADRDVIEPPPGLAARTLARIAGPTKPLPRAPAHVGRSGISGRSFWRRPDALVAASLLLVAAGVAMTWILRLRQAHEITTCQNNLRQFYGALKSFSELHHNNFPNVAEVSLPKKRQVAGLVVPILASSGQLDAATSIRCPGTGGGPFCSSLTLEKVQEMSDEQFTLQAVMLACSYGYSLGYRDEEGQLQGPRYTSDRPNAQLPLMSDCPPVDPRMGNSTNHDGQGQNVLYADGHVCFCTSRYVGVGGDDIFVNRAHQVGAGLDLLDTVIGRSGARP